MAREKKTHPIEMTEGKRNIIQQLLQEYEIEIAEDIQDALKDLLGRTIKEMMGEEIDEYLGYRKDSHSENPNSCNGYKEKLVHSRYGDMKILISQDR